MKRYLVALLILIVAVPVFAQMDTFLSPDQVVKEIAKYFQEVERELTPRIYLIEIAKSEEDSNLMFVYFLKNEDPTLIKDFYNNIDSGKVSVMVAIYNYSHLKFTWRLKKVKRFKERLIFKVD